MEIKIDSVTFLVDDDLPSDIINRAWYIKKTKRGLEAVSSCRKTGYKILHREVIGAKKGEEIHFKNGLTQDCRLENLYVKKKDFVKETKHSYKGVFFNGTSYVAITSIKNKSVYVGSYKTPKKAHEAREEFINQNKKS